uniref:Uncharacterized protein n=1 Tax=Setaria viridis TaxID=4556 RepID=A0A4U6W5A9_SETVI|nr:hypothetical protein SEVIR_1G067100v2 [Setaria viridis]
MRPPLISLSFSVLACRGSREGGQLGMGGNEKAHTAHIPAAIQILGGYPVLSASSDGRGSSDPSAPATYCLRPAASSPSTTAPLPEPNLASPPTSSLAMDAGGGGSGSGQLFSVDPLERQAARGHGVVTSMAAGSDVIVLGTSPGWLVRHDYTFEDAHSKSRRCKDLQLMNENMEVLQSLKLVSTENENSNKGDSVLFIVCE